MGNLFPGGGNPRNILVDSDLDWGQDVKRLATRLHEVGREVDMGFPLQVTDFEKEFGFPPIDMRMDVVRILLSAGTPSA